jgi:hypothetical protein
MLVHDNEPRARERAGRIMRRMMEMKKIDLAALQKVYDEN